MANERVLIAAAIYQGWVDAQSETPGIALPARLWLLNGANGWLDVLDCHYDMRRLVEGLDPLPQASFYEMAWGEPEPMTMTCPTPEVDPEPVEPEPLPVVYGNELTAHVCGWLATQR